MPIAKILVPVAGDDSDEAAIATAFCAAKPFGAHVALLAVHEDPALSVPLVGVPLPAETIAAIMDGQTRHANMATARARHTMTDLSHREDVAVVAAPVCDGQTSCSLQQSWGNVAVTIANAAALSDLIVLGPMGWKSRPEFNEAFLDVLREVRRPLLVAHRAPRRALARIAIGWDGSAAAANAVRGALDLLCLAKETAIIAIAGRHGAAETRDLEDYLTRNGVAFGVQRHEAGALSAGDALALAARDWDADLLVAGAYGHDHLREALFGGATETLAAGTATPLLLAH